MRPGMLMLILLAVSACIPIAGLRATPVFPIALLTGILCAGAGLMACRFRPVEIVLFLLAQPCIFLSWEISPYLPPVLESVLIPGLLSSLGLLEGKGSLSFAVIFLMIMAVITIPLSRVAHVFLPLFIFLIAAGLALFGILGLAFRITSRAGGGLP